MLTPLNASRRVPRRRGCSGLEPEWLPVTLPLLALCESQDGLLVALANLPLSVRDLQDPAAVLLACLSDSVGVVRPQQGRPDVGHLLSRPTSRVVDLEADVVGVLERSSVLEGRSDIDHTVYRPEAVELDRH